MLTYEWHNALPVAQTELTFSVSGFALLVILVVLGAYIGNMRGVRSILTIALGTIVAYLLCVQGGEQVVGVINQIWQNAPRTITFAAGRDPNLVPLLDPLISADIQVPLFFRFIFFIAIVAIAWFFNKGSKWYGASAVRHEPLAPILGAFAGALIALLWSNAAARFYTDYRAIFGPIAPPVGTALGILPDVSAFIPSLIFIFMFLLILVLFFYLPRLVTVPEAPKR